MLLEKMDTNVVILQPINFPEPLSLENETHKIWTRIEVSRK